MEVTAIHGAQASQMVGEGRKQMDTAQEGLQAFVAGFHLQFPCCSFLGRQWVKGHHTGSQSFPERGASNWG